MAGQDFAFLHGGRHGGWCWERVIAAMAGRPGVGRLAALDVPGCGIKRGRDIADITLAQAVAELNQDLRDQGLRDVVLVGHSLAGIMLPAMALADPALFRELIFLATCVPREGESVADQMGTAKHWGDPDAMGWPLDPAATPPLEMQRAMFTPDMTPADMAWIMRETQQDNWPPQVVPTRMDRTGFIGLKPVSFIVTLRDPILPQAWQGRFAERIGTTGFYSLDTPHEPFVTHPQETADLLLQIAGVG